MHIYFVFRTSKIKKNFVKILFDFFFRSATFMNPKFRSQNNKNDMQLPQWLCRLSVGNELVNNFSSINFINKFCES